MNLLYEIDQKPIKINYYLFLLKTLSLTLKFCFQKFEEIVEADFQKC